MQLAPSAATEKTPDLRLTEVRKKKKEG